MDGSGDEEGGSTEETGRAGDQTGRTRRAAEAEGFSERDSAFVESLWDDARTARLSELYYGERVDFLGKLNFGAELLVLISASGSGIAGWAVWQGKIGATFWAIVAGLAALLAVAKPLLSLDRRMKDSARQQQLYRTILGSLENLAFDIQQAGDLTSEHRRRYQRTREQLRQAETGDVAAPRLKTRARLAKMVNQEMPPASLWLPTRDGDPNPA